MNFAKRITPKQFLPADWDQAWALGWFRMRQTLFTTHFLEFERQFYSAVWLRVGLPTLAPDKTFLELKKRNRRFRVEFAAVEPSGPDAVHEELYQRYRRSLAFEPADTLHDLLFGQEEQTHFSTWEVNLYDGEKLIASGSFDLGEKAAAGITSYYDPLYHKHSLGKYLIYCKMEWCRDRGFDWFYPGYAAPGQPRFDYKWAMGASTLEYLDLFGGAWRPRDRSIAPPDPLQAMRERLTALVSLLEGRGFQPRLLHFLHLDINLNPQVQGVGLFDFPVFIDCFPSPEKPPALVAVFDPRDGRYYLLVCRTVYQFEALPDAPGTPLVFASDLLLIERVLSAGEEAQVAASSCYTVRLQEPL